MPPGMQTPEEVVKYLLLVMKHSEIKPDYHAIAQEAGIASANNAQKRFKKCVELNGFRLVAGAVVGSGSSADDASPVKPKAPVKPRAPGKRAAAATAAGSPAQAKKRKIGDLDSYEEEEEEDEYEDVKGELGTKQE